MNEAVQTIEGWYALHHFRSMNWYAWNAASPEEQQQALKQLDHFLADWEQTQASNQGSTAVYSILGHKADFVFIHFRQSLEELNELEIKFNKSAFASYTFPTYSYVSVVELSSYLAKPGIDPMQDPDMLIRLKPIMPKTKHMCFYPMSKRRDGADNWYMLTTEERKTFMRSHGMIGRTYAGKVKQIITGSVGFDDWEWGVTLFADDPLHIKKLIYEMRFDEASARFAEFGDFYIGNLLDSQKFTHMLNS